MFNVPGMLGPELALAAGLNLALVLLLGVTFARRTWPDQLPLWVPGLGLALLLLCGVGGVAYTLSLFGVLSGPELLTYLLDEPSGRAWLLALIGGLVLLAAEASRWPWLALLPSAALMLYGTAVQGHAAMGGWPTITAQMVHLAAMSVWVGGVLALALGRPQTPAGLDRMTNPALLSLLALALTGWFAAAVQGGSLSTLRVSTYGWALAQKLVLIASAVAAAGWLRLRLSRALSPKPALHAELAALLLVLLASAWLGNTVPSAHVMP
ncbi:hypothetical protein [Deinococcus radiophilus]|uniref:Copper resistance protein D domain-containing protein n=1 Tax=Deinococcus radiophilus TaxID=32062 RepID=A0A3S0KKH2_9DEIO|nr:hypothetical protein [Deinococcus radiophilus]RTR28703.1 hypothetical protein EJ104_04945 [Deinococcus radiophilus]UFA51126.1 hypothetical protein LMT64_04305 [Deinococcus radiophilus]